jgi:hypothetical protein
MAIKRHEWATQSCQAARISRVLPSAFMAPAMPSIFAGVAEVGEAVDGLLAARK